MVKILISFCFFSVLLPLAASETFIFGTRSNPEKAEVSEIDGCYQVVCVIKDNGKRGKNQDSLNRLKAQKICLLGIASYRKGKKVSRCSATVRGMTLQKEPEKRGEELFFVFTIPIDGVAEKDVQTVQ